MITRTAQRPSPVAPVIGERSRAITETVRSSETAPLVAASPAPQRKPPVGSRPSIEWALVADLKVDDSYQRSIDTGPSRKLISAIADAWDWRMCMPLVVSRRDDGLYVIDGQHRHAAAVERRDIDQLPCVVARYVDAAEEAEMFVRMNRARRAVNRLDEFHAAEVSGDPETRAIAKLITDAGFTVSRKTGSASWIPGDVAFTAAIAKVRRKHGDGVCQRALEAMEGAFPDQVLVAGSSVFLALTRLLVMPPPGFQEQHLFEALRLYDMKGWASFLTGSKGGDERAQRIREALIMAMDDAAKDEAEEAP